MGARTRCRNATVTGSGHAPCCVAPSKISALLRLQAHAFFLVGAVSRQLWSQDGLSVTIWSTGRHAAVARRCRYEVNPKYIEQVESVGLKFVGKDDKGERMEVRGPIHPS